MLAGDNHRAATSCCAADIDFDAPAGLDPVAKVKYIREKQQEVAALILSKKEELGLLMLERSATKGLHIVFKRRTGLSQEENLKLVDSILSGGYVDMNAKDLNRIFFTPTSDHIVFIDDELFSTDAVTETAVATKSSSLSIAQEAEAESFTYLGDEIYYNGFTFTEITQAWFDLFENGLTPVAGNRNIQTFNLAYHFR